MKSPPRGGRLRGVTGFVELGRKIPGTPRWNRTTNSPLGGACYVHLTMEAAHASGTDAIGKVRIVTVHGQVRIGAAWPAHLEANASRAAPSG